MKRFLTILAVLAPVYLLLSLWPAEPAPRAGWTALGGRPLVIAHGMGQGLGPQNTIEAGRRSLAAGADAIELDVRLSADGRLVVIHDAALEATTDGSGRIDQMTLAEIQSFDAGVGFADPTGRTPFAGQGIVVPSLRQVFEALTGTRYVIEIKPERPGTARALCERVREFGLEARTLIGSFHTEALRRFRRFCPEVATSMGEGEVRRYVYLSMIGLSNLAPVRGAAIQVPRHAEGLTILSPGFIETAHARGLEVHAWTINDSGEMGRLVEMGVDGLITDYPDRARAVLERGD